MTAKTRLMMETFAKETAIQDYKKQFPFASDQDAWRFAVGHWRDEQYLMAGAECLALLQVIDETAAAPFN